jgi:hypothetical protein
MMAIPLLDGKQLRHVAQLLDQVFMSGSGPSRTALNPLSRRLMEMERTPVYARLHRRL